MKIVNSQLAQSIQEQGMLKPPNNFGYIMLAAEIEKTAPYIKVSKKKKALIKSLRSACRDLKKEAQVNRADLFKAFLIPPGNEEGKNYLKEHDIDMPLAKYDVIVLIESESVSVLEEVEKLKIFEDVLALFKSQTKRFYKTRAKNIKRIDEVNKNKKGVFLFNFFYAKDKVVVQEVWEYTAGWWTAKANLTNSTALQPIDTDTSYQLINHCKWDKASQIIPILILGKLGMINGFNNFVLKNFTENDIVAMPVLYRLVT
jgi:hypothetical protein|tara:strand:- start:161 stop:934 length:774 start_codon:yes stop_codon:yes gene_type:complete